MPVTNENFNISRCPHCGVDPGHPIGESCPRLKRVRYRPDGSIEVIEYHDHKEETPAPLTASEETN